jgi:hypothetical protein
MAVMKGDDIAKIFESFRIRYQEFEATGLPAVVCAIGIVLVARGIANLLTNNAEAALRGLIFARTPPRPTQAEPRGEPRRTVS